jgi:hypothetical protein
MPTELAVGFIVMSLDGRVLEGPVHSLDCPLVQGGLVLVNRCSVRVPHGRALVLRLVDKDRAWVKLSGAYQDAGHFRWFFADWGAWPDRAKERLRHCAIWRAVLAWRSLGKARGSDRNCRAKAHSRIDAPGSPSWLKLVSPDQADERAETIRGPAGPFSHQKAGDMIAPANFPSWQRTHDLRAPSRRDYAVSLDGPPQLTWRSHVKPGP